MPEKGTRYPDQTAEILELRLSGMKWSDIGKRFDLSPGATRARRRFARPDQRARLDEVDRLNRANCQRGKSHGLNKCLVDPLEVTTAEECAKLDRMFPDLAGAERDSRS